VLKKKIWPNFQRFIELFTQKIVTKLFKIRVWDPGSEIRDPGKTYSGYRIRGSKRHRIPDPGSGSGSTTLLFTVMTLKRIPYVLYKQYLKMQYRCPYNVKYKTRLFFL
jgi:hypothetical protein